MSQKPRKFHIVASIEDTSILRKFTTLFLLMSIIPMGILYYFYMQIKHKGALQIGESEFALTLLFVVLGVAVGYFAMRSALKKIIDLTQANRKALGNFLSPETVEELNHEENEIAVLTRSFQEITAKLEDNVRSLEAAKATLHNVLSKIGDGISSMDNIDSFLELILETVTEAFQGDVSTLWLIKQDRLELKSSFFSKGKPPASLSLNLHQESIFEKVIKSKVPFVALNPNDLARLPNDILRYIHVPLICAPLVLHEHVIGLVTVSSHNPLATFAHDEKKLLQNLASQTAVAIENARLNHDIESTYYETISALALAVDAKDQYSRGHLDRVADHVVLIGKNLGLEEEEISILREAARLHDVGKIGIPDDILRKEGPLSDEEWSIMRKHPLIGESIVKPVRSMSRLCDIIRHHHEKLDGSGYPDGLKAEQISPLVRITTIADIYDALTTNRPYRQRFSKEAALLELRKMKDKIDQDILEVFAEALDSEDE